MSHLGLTIVHVTHRLGGAGGVELYVDALARAQAALPSRPEVVVVTAEPPPPKSAEIPAQAIGTGGAAPYRVIRVGRGAGLDPAWVVSLAGRAVVHLHQIDPLGLDPAVALAKRLPTVWTMHDLAPAGGVTLGPPVDERSLWTRGPGSLGLLGAWARLQQLQKRQHRASPAPDAARESATAQSPLWPIDQTVRRAAVERLISACRVVTAPCAFFRDYLVGDGVRGAEAIEPLPLGHVLAEAPPLLTQPAPQPGHVRFGFVGSFTAAKGLRVLLRAFRRVPGKQTSLDVFGGSPWPVDQADIRDQTGFDRRVTLHGAFDRSALSGVFARFDVLVHPSLCYEGEPLTLVEASLLNRLIIASDTGGQAEFMARGRVGLVARAGDERAFARAMTAVNEDPAAWFGEGRYLPPPVAPMPTHAQAVLSLYRRAISGNR
jgi:glycosyltransferase involved in cell wall biosynthesis